MNRIALCILFAIASLLPFQKAEAKVYLVVVGISDYPGTSNDLRHPVDDARLVVNTYKTKAPDLVFVQLYDNRATASNILSSLQNLFSKATSDDIVVLFVSGHGYEGGYVAYDGFLPWSRLRDVLAKCRSKHKMIFADTCFSGTFRSNRSGSKPKRDGHTNVMLFLSSRSNETSAESASMKQGIFSAFLCNGLKGRADANRDKVVTAKELYKYVYQGVVRKTAGKQHPVMWGNFSNNMPVIRLK